ncbi:hypothetical protein [Paenibacillus chungangensis]|uniref:Uncharacterized protein n=1 Tax=Paenibacillus chungangensis TaxID=696535 RepID=A0ABW3HUD6_9BACL
MRAGKIAIAVSIIVLAAACQNGGDDLQRTFHHDPILRATVQPNEMPSLKEVPTEEVTEEVSEHMDDKLRLRKLEDGFQLLYEEDEGEEIHVMETFVSPAVAGHSYAVHIVRRTVDSEDYLVREAVVVNASGQSYKVYQLYEANVEDIYNPDSVAKAYGFLDDRHLLYVGVANEQEGNGYYYEVKKLNIETGETETIVPMIPDVPHDDFFSRGWLNEKKDKLILITHGTGLMWSIDLANGNAKRTEHRFKQPWPFFMTTPSADGDAFWYYNYETSVYTLHDSDGNLLAERPPIEGYDTYPAFMWSPDSRYAAFHHTKDRDSSKPIQDVGEWQVVAMDRIIFMDKFGNEVATVEAVPGTNVEAVGWLEGNGHLVLIRQYEWELEDDEGNSGIGAKGNSQFYLFNIESGHRTKLRMVEGVPRARGLLPIRTANPVTGLDQALFLVNLEQSIVITSTDSGRWITDDSDTSFSWTADDVDSNRYIHYRYDTATGETTVLSTTNSSDVHSIGQDWLATSDMRYVQLSR